MPRTLRDFTNNEIYHVVLRGVEQRKIFLDEDDYYRGIFSLYEFNTTRSIEIRERRREREKFKLAQKVCGGQTPANLERYQRDLLVEILSFCLMPNHVHLLLRQLKSRGISRFVQKFGSGYAAYFNKKYKRVGHLFQGRFRSVRVETDDQLKNVFVYIHTNPVARIEPGWKEKGVRTPAKAKKFLEKYRWSSYLDYIGKKNFPSVTERQFLAKVMGRRKGSRKAVNDWLGHKGNIAKLGDIVLE